MDSNGQVCPVKQQDQYLAVTPQPHETTPDPDPTSFAIIVKIALPLVCPADFYTIRSWSLSSFIQAMSGPSDEVSILDTGVLFTLY